VKALGVLDRYVVRQWLGTFVLSALGLPAVAILIDLSERFAKLVDKGVTIHDILIGQLFYFPNKMAMMLPAAVLFATVFTLNALGRHSELTAVKAGGVSFFRLIAPLMVLAVLSVPLDYGLQELSSYSTLQEKIYHKERSGAEGQARVMFGYAAPSGWNWAIKSLVKDSRLISSPVMEEAAWHNGGRWTVAADSARWFTRPGPAHWVLFRGASVFLADSGLPVTFEFERMQHRDFTDPPSAMMDEGLKADEMTYPQLKRYLVTLGLSGNHPGMLAVDLPLKFAVPLACLVVAMFGAPLAVTNPRAGAALGLAIALGTTLIYLTGIQIMKAVGGQGLLSPWLAAWSMNIVFVVVAVVLLWRVRS
jgi:lipopolysaccharide export system permease protein